MSDDLAAKAANWVPPWQRPAEDGPDGEAVSAAGPEPGSELGLEPDAEPGSELGSEPGSELAAEPAAEAGSASGSEADGEAGPAGQWGRLAGAKWQTMQPGEAPDEEPFDERSLDDDPSDPQLSDCVDEDDESQDELGAVALLTGDERELGEEGEPGTAAESGDELGAVALLTGDEQQPEDEADDEDEAESDDDDGDGGGELAGEWEPGDTDEIGQGQLFVPAQRVAEQAPGVSEADLVPALEAILMVVDEPVGEILLAQVLDIPAEKVANALIELSARYTEEGKGFDLRRAAGGWRFYTRAEYSSYVEKFVLDGQQLRLTQASLETLAVVAYKQPVTRSRISAIRGVNCDGVVRTLITRGLIEECGTEPESGAHLYRTTNLFLEKLGLDTVAQLPPLAPFLPDNLDEVALNE